MAQTGDLQGIIKKVSEYESTYTGDLKARIDEDAEVRRILDMPEDNYRASEDDQNTLKEFFYNNESDIWLRTLKTIIPLDVKIPVMSARVKQAIELESIVDAVRDGSIDKLPKLHSRYVELVNEQMDKLSQQVESKAAPTPTPSARLVPKDAEKTMEPEALVDLASNTLQDRLIDANHASGKTVAFDRIQRAFSYLSENPKSFPRWDGMTEADVKTAQRERAGHMKALNTIPKEFKTEFHELLQMYRLRSQVEQSDFDAADLQTENLVKEFLGSKEYDSTSTSKEADFHKYVSENHPDAVDSVRLSDPESLVGLEPKKSSTQRVQDAVKAEADNPKPNITPEEVEADSAKLEKDLAKLTYDERWERVQEDIRKVNEMTNRAAPASQPLKNTTEEAVRKIVGDEESNLLFKDNISVKDWWELAPKTISYFIKARSAKVKSEQLFLDIGHVFGTGDQLGSLDIKDVAIESVGEGSYRRLNQYLTDVKKGEMDVADARDKLRAWAIETERTEILGAVSDHRARNQLQARLAGKSVKEKLKIIKVFVDGLSRKGVKRIKGSIADRQSAQIVRDISSIRSVLSKHKLIDLFNGKVDNGKGLPSDVKESFDGKLGGDASEAFIEDILRYYQSGVTPDRWKGKSKEAFKDVAEAVKNTLRAQVAALNRHGAGIRIREDHLGLTPTWDTRTIRKMGLAEFSKNLEDAIDWKKTAQAHGYLIKDQVGDNGDITRFAPFDKGRFIRQWYDEILGTKDPVDHWSRDISNFFSKSRMIHIIKGKEFDTIKKFSGDKSVGRLLQDQIRRRSEMISIADTMGNKPLKNFDDILRSNEITPESSGVIDTAFGSVQRVRNTMRQLAGELDDPLNREMSEWGKGVRSFSHLAYLSTSTLSAISDIPVALMTLDQLGTGTSMLELLGSVKNAASRRFHGSEPSLRAFYDGSGAARDAVMSASAGANRMALLEDGDGTLISKGADAMFSLNGLNFWTGIMQDAFLDVLTRSLGEQARTGNWNPHTKMTMESFGFDRDDFKHLLDSVEDINGVNRVGASSVAGTPLEMKMLEFMTHYMDEAVLVPDASTQSLIRFGVRAGTWEGEAIRTLFQYSSFPLAMNRIVMRNLLVNSGGDSPWTTNQISSMRLAVYAGSMLGLGYVSTALKDLSKLRTPMMPWDLNARTTARVIDQSGISGVLGSVWGAASGDPMSVSSPLPRDVVSSVGSLFTEGVGAAAYDAKALLIAPNLPVAGPLVTGFMAQIANESIGQQYRGTVDALERMYGNISLVPAPPKLDTQE